QGPRLAYRWPKALRRMSSGSAKGQALKIVGLDYELDARPASSRTRPGRWKEALVGFNLRIEVAFAFPTLDTQVMGAENQGRDDEDHSSCKRRYPMDQKVHCTLRLPSASRMIPTAMKS